jgi:hypothetical protein
MIFYDIFFREKVFSDHKRFLFKVIYLPCDRARSCHPLTLDVSECQLLSFRVNLAFAACCF